MNKNLATGIVVAGVVVVALVILAAAKGDSPIEVADGSIELYFKYGFDTEATNRIKASKLLHRTIEIQVWDKSGANSAADTIEVKGRDWTLTSADRTLRVQRSAGISTDAVAISAPENAVIQPVIPGDSVRFRYDNGSRFTPATLSFTDGKPLPTCRNPVAGSNSCTLSCPTNYCSVRFQYKF